MGPAVFYLLLIIVVTHLEPLNYIRLLWLLLNKNHIFLELVTPHPQHGGKGTYLTIGIVVQNTMTENKMVHRGSAHL